MRLNELGGEEAQVWAGALPPLDPAGQNGASADSPLGESSSGEGSPSAERPIEERPIAERLPGEGSTQGGPIEEASIQEGSVRLRAGSGFFRPESRPSRDLGVLLAQHLVAQRRQHRPDAPGLRVLDLMAGCGIRSLRYGIEAGAAAVWANDADPDRLALLQHGPRHGRRLPRSD